MVRDIGTAARKELERELGARVFLDLQVRVRERWRRDEGLLDRLGHRLSLARPYDCADERSPSVIRRERPGPVRDPGLEHRRGADARLHERRGAAAHPRDRRDPLLQPLARGAVAQGRDLGQRAAAAAAALRLRRRRAASRWSSPAGPACHTGERSCFYRDLEGADGASAAGRRARPRHEALPALERTLRGAARRAPRGLLHGRAARRPAADRRRRCARRPTRSPAPRRASPTSGSPRRPPTSSTTSRCCCSRAACRSRRRWRCSMSASPLSPARPIEPGLERARELAREANVIPVSLPVRRRLRDARSRPS